MVLTRMKLWKCLRLRRELPRLYRGKGGNRGWGGALYESFGLRVEEKGHRMPGGYKLQKHSVTAGRGVEDEDGAVPSVCCMMTLENCFRQRGRK